MAVTDWTEDEALNFPKRKELVDPSVSLADSKIGFKDLNFWGEDNIIEPENTIENAIKKIQRKLKRLKE